MFNVSLTLHRFNSQKALICFAFIKCHEMKPFSHPPSCPAGVISHLPALQSFSCLNSMLSGFGHAAKCQNFNILEQVSTKRTISDLAGPLGALCSTSYVVWDSGGLREGMKSLFFLGDFLYKSFIYWSKAKQEPTTTKDLRSALLYIMHSVCSLFSGASQFILVFMKSCLVWLGTCEEMQKI